MSTPRSSKRSSIPLGLAEQHTSQAIQQDRVLIDRCLSGEVAAWEELYQDHHAKLLRGIRLRLGPRSSDLNLADEIAARVWYVVVADRGCVLDRFDPGRGCRLSTYLATIAKSEASSLFRSERRRHRRERSAGARLSPLGSMEQNVLIEWSEFVLRLTPREREFLSGFLLAACPPGTGYSPTSKWQLSSRIHHKLKWYIKED